MERLPEDLPECLVFLLGKAYQKAHGDFKQRLRPYGLTNMQHLVLEGLWYREGMTAAELGKCLVLDKATLSGVLERLAEAGWIEKKPDPSDRRVQQLYPSDKANAMKDQLVGERKTANEEMMSRFTPEERMLLKRLLRDLM
ncbi:MarR family transcriptional regulator [Desulfonema ishimotonii]|uniref:MarR family transcriptional regulator n=1 Tax=Desulfonema ishimotonii TaxID=45657 RepID=A0A401G0R0_9BACT|nr:MarR family transcriptional regulator [Desulfonema ishimotonii]GBC62804.1 MarR family transcriptional regulator [Desulfonema ishimotonii]